MSTAKSEIYIYGCMSVLSYKKHCKQATDKFNIPETVTFEFFVTACDAFE